MCGTDLHLVDGSYATGRYPVVPGHEFAGTIVAVGGEVQDISPGDLAGVDPNVNCGACRWCRVNAYNLCERLEPVGVTRGGACAEHVVERWQIPLMLEPVMLGAPRTPEVIEAEEQAARIAFDLGAHIIKIAFPGEDGTRRMVEELGLPVVIAGGPRTGEPAETIEAVRQTVVAGARGIIVGRNIWQRDLPEAHAVVEQLAALTRNRGRTLQTA
jgi:hypothetical protein